MVTVDLQQQIKKVITASVLKKQVSTVALFGSRLHGKQTKDSDIDLLIEFSSPVSMFALVHLERELSQALGQTADLVTPHSLSKYFKQEVLAEAKPLYQATI
jgi:uncharacterized protein